jgi:hypothetical protein
MLWWYSWTNDPEDMRRDHVPQLDIEPNSLVRAPRLLTLFLPRQW